MNPTENTKRWVAAILFTLWFIFIGYTCSGQPPMKFILAKDSTTETIYVGLSHTKQGYVLLVSSDKQDRFDVFIGFPDGSVAFFPIINAGQCEVSELALKRLKSSQFDSILFESAEDVYVCTEIETPDYFINKLKVK